jgi:membrane dipeptidase
VTRIVDAHSDLLLELVHRSGEEAPFERYYLEQLQRGGVGLQLCAMCTLPGYLPDRALRHMVEQVGAFWRAVRENSGTVAHVRTVEDLAEVEADGRLGLLLTIEGVEVLGVDPGLFDFFWDAGVRMVGLTWMFRNAFAEGNMEPPVGGLSALGRQLVDFLAERGAIIDLAHTNEGTFRDVLAQAPNAPVVISHGGCRALFDTPRNTSDEQLRALADRDGVIGIVTAPMMLTSSGDTALERMVEHIDHVVQVVGIEHVGIGSDFMRQLWRSGAIPPEIMGKPAEQCALMDLMFDGVPDSAGLPLVARSLEQRGYDADAIEAVLGGNFLRVLRRALPSAAATGLSR